MSALSDALDRYLGGDDQALKSYFLKGKPMVARSDASGFPPPPAKPAYPWVGISSGGSIVLFCEPRRGTVIGHSCIAKPSLLTSNPIGLQSSAWGESEFVLYAGKVTLYNE